MSGPTKKIIKSKDDIELYYEVYSADAEAAGPALFFIHGLGGDMDAWQYVRDKLLKKGFPCIAMDIRGHGKSGHPYSSKQYSLHNFIEDAITVLDAEKIDKTVLIGHSLGAVLASHIAIHRQERTDKLILISGNYAPPLHFRIPGIFLFIKTLALLSPPPLRLRHSVYPMEKFHKDIEVFGLMRTIMNNSLRSYMLSFMEISKINIASFLRAIKIPTLLISGDKDSIFPAYISNYIHSQIPESQLKIISGANHVVILNNAEETADHISDFLVKPRHD